MAKSHRPTGKNVGSASFLASPHTKIGLSWAGAAALCLTGYYFARIWAHDQKGATLKIKRELTEEHIVTKLKQSSDALKDSR